MYLVFLLATVLTAQAHFDFVGNLNIQITGTGPQVFRNYSDPFIVYEGTGSVTISLSAYKFNATGATYGSYKGGSCFIHYGSVLSQTNNATLTNVQNIPMNVVGFDGANSTNDVYSTKQLNLPIGMYQATAYCFDLADNSTTNCTCPWGNLAFNFEVVPTPPSPTFSQVQTLYDNSYNCSGKIIAMNITNVTSCVPACQSTYGPAHSFYLATDCLPVGTAPSIPEGTWVHMLGYTYTNCLGFYEEVWYATNVCMLFPGGFNFFTCNSTGVFTYGCNGAVQYCCSNPLNACTTLVSKNSNVLSCEVVTSTSPTTSAAPSLAPTASPGPTTSNPTTSPTSTSTKAPSAASHNQVRLLPVVVLLAVALCILHLS